MCVYAVYGAVSRNVCAPEHLNGSSWWKYLHAPVSITKILAKTSSAQWVNKLLHLNSNVLSVIVCRSFWEILSVAYVNRIQNNTMARCECGTARHTHIYFRYVYVVSSNYYLCDGEKRMRSFSFFPLPRHVTIDSQLLWKQVNKGNFVGRTLSFQKIVGQEFASVCIGAYDFRLKMSVLSVKSQKRDHQISGNKEM